MKKIILVLATLVLVFTFASCNKEKIDLSSYQIVIPENASITIEYSAQNLSDLIKNKFGITVLIVNDSVTEKNNEILIGETNRNASKTDISLSENQFLLVKKDDKIVLKGNGVYIGSACGKLVNEHLTVKNDELFIKNLKSEEAIYTYEEDTACENVIFMIGDGMGENHIELAEKNKNFTFISRQFPNFGWSITRSQSVINHEITYTDSAASATAMSTGYKTLNGYLGLDKDGNIIQNVRELAHSIGAKTGVLTTDKITGATPSAYLCHNDSRYNTEELQTEIDNLIANGKVDYCKGDVDNNLTNETKNALNQISKDGSQFFIMIEEAYIDKNSHNNNISGTIDAVVRFNDAIEYATQFALMHPRTALIVTADHETGKLTKSKLHSEGYAFMSTNHTNVNVPVFALGANTSIFNNATIENVELAKFTAKAYTTDDFGMSLDDLPTLNTKTIFYHYVLKDIIQRNFPLLTRVNFISHRAK